MTHAKVAIIGRPNVGKSTLFNRLVGKKLALVDDQPGVTRDRREGEGRLGPLRFTVIDTPGLEEAPEASLEGRMRQQTERAIDEAAVCLFLIDARQGLTPLDRSFAMLLRQSGKPVVVLANKAESRAGEAGVYDAYALGFGEPIAFSGEHGQGLSELYDMLETHLVAADDQALAGEPDEEHGWDNPLKPLRIAIVGRPNAGKSTLVNRLLGEDRMLTGPEAGITRDSVSVEWTWKAATRDWPIKLWDTAGIRKKARVVSKLEKLSVADALRAIKFAEVVIVLVDALEPFEKQDLQIADLVLREGRALVIAVNKWDLVEDKDESARAIREQAARLLPQAEGVVPVFISAATGRNVDKLMPAATAVYVDWNARVKTPDLNAWLKAALDRHPPPAVQGRRIKIKYMSQIKTRPPTFVAHGGNVDALPASYQRYLINGLREAFELPGVPIRLFFRQAENPFAED